MEVKKNPKANLEKNKSMFFEVGLIVSLALVLLAFEWKSFEEKDFLLGDLQIDVEEEIIPITQQNQPPPPPPPPPAPPEEIEIVEDDEEVEDIDMMDTEIDENTAIEETYEEEEEVAEEQIFVSVENMPTLPGCEGITNKMKRDQCTQQKIYQHLGKVQKYPTMMKEAGIEGTVFITFVVDKKGKVTDVEVLRGVAGGKALDNEAVRMIQSLPSFKPGTQQGKAVKIRYNLPIRFKLQ